MGVRVAGVLERAGRILLVEHRKAGRSSWLLPGGGIDVGERAADALRRELEEELRLRVSVGELLFLVETRSPGSERFIQPTFRIEPDPAGDTGEEDDTWAGGRMGVGGDPRVVGYRFFDGETLRNMTLYPDIGNELAFFLENGVFPRRYLYKPWID